MAKKTTGLEGQIELARVIHRWVALRNKPGDDKAYELATAVSKLHNDVLHNGVEIRRGLRELAPLAQQVVEHDGGGRLFDEARQLAQNIVMLNDATTS